MSKKETTMQTSTETKNAKTETSKAKPAEAAPAQTETAPVAADSAADTDDKKVRRGVVPTMPSCVIYELGGRFYAAIHHPVDGTSYTESGKGIGSAKGALEDSGFHLSAMTADGPEWLSDRVPAGATVHGYASIKGFPLPKQ